MNDSAIVLVASERIPEELRADAAQRLRAVGALVGERRDLDAGRAEEWLAAGVGLVALREALRPVERPGELDVIVRPSGLGAGPGVLVADLESTVIRNEMLDELAEAAGVGDRVAEITARAMNGELDFQGALEERLGLLAGRPTELLERVRERIVVDPGAGALIATLRTRGWRTALVSGGFATFAEPVARALGFDDVHANRFTLRDGRLAPGISGPLVDREEKRRLLERLAEEAGVERSDTVAIGDGANDLAMLCAAGLGLAWRGKPRVAAEAPARLTVGDLSTVLLALGVPRREWADG